MPVFIIIIYTACVVAAVAGIVDYVIWCIRFRESDKNEDSW